MLAVRRLTMLVVLPMALVAGLVAPTAAQASGAVRPHQVSTATASIVNPVEGARLAVGDVFVDALGSVSSVAGGGIPQTLTLLVDGAEVDTESCDTTPSPTSCASELYWDSSTSTPGVHQLTAKMATSLTISGPSLPVNITLVSLPVPVVAITSPAAGATVAGIVHVTASASVDGSFGDFPLALGLFVDGHLVGDVVSCALGSATCSGALAWDANSLSGTHILEVAVETDQNFAVSRAVLVTVVNPPPIVAITTPLAASSVSGQTTVTATGTVDAAVSDSVRSLQLIVDGVDAALVPCSPASPHSCAASFTWDTAGLVGPHNLQVRLVTLRTTALSPVSTVSVAPRQTRFWLTQLASVHRGSSATVSGRLAESTTLQGAIRNATVQVTLTPAGGTPVTTTATTNAVGVFTVIDPNPVLVNTLVHVTAGPEYGSSSASMLIPVMTPIACAMPAKAKHATQVTVTCSAPLLPNGVAVQLRDLDKGEHVLATAKAKNGKVRLTFTLPKKRKYPLEIWAMTLASQRFSATISRAYRIRAV